MGNICSCHHEPMPQKTTVFVPHVYRIPALFYDKDKEIFLAFAEQRYTADDASAKNLVMKTGRLKEESSGERTIEWSELKLVKEASLDGHRSMNPCPVYDKKNKKLFLFFICVEGTVSEQWQIDNNTNKARLCYVTSTDDGETWSTVTDLFDKDGLDVIKNSATFSVGPGHGIQMKSGRLVVPTYAFPKKERQQSPKSYALSLYSDDSGETWHLGNMLRNESNECQMAECFDDKGSFVYCNARSKGGYRVEAVSENKGADLKHQSANKLVETGGGCQGSVVSFPAEGKDANPNKWLLFTHPSDQSKRVNLGVYLNKSPRDPDTWSKLGNLKTGPSGYSDLAYIGDGWFACLVECGELKETEQIACEVFHYDGIKPTEGTEKKKN